MSDLESFSASESMNQGSTAESFRLFQERMKVAAAQMAAIKAGEQKQKKKEDQLAKILLEFIKSKQNNPGNQEFLSYISLLLALNIPARFIISILILNFKDLQEKIGLLLEAPKELSDTQRETNTISLKTEALSTVKQLPDWVKQVIERWLSQIIEAANTDHEKISKTAIINEKWENDIIEFSVFSLRFYLNNLGYDFPDEQIQGYINYSFEQILKSISASTEKLQLPSGD